MPVQVPPSPIDDENLPRPGYLRWSWRIGGDLYCVMAGPTTTTTTTTTTSTTTTTTTTTT